AWAPAITRLDFGLVTAGTVSAVQSATLVNNGPGGAIVNLVNAVGVDASAFSVAGGTCVVGMTLFQGDTCRVDVQFAPAFAGDRSAAVQVASTGSFPPALALVGTGLAGPSPGLTLSVTALQFGDTRIGAQSVPLEVTLSGTGSGVVRVTALDINGPYAVQNKTCPSVPFVLQAGGACTVTVSFLPQAEGSASGSLSVTSDATPATGNVALSGTGEPKPDLSSGGCSLSSGDSLADPTLWALMALAVAALFYRRRARRPPGSNRRERP
ncbi:MAG TPA: choice-of-anchor D domain-containing protein, partial [Caldimonas sp.]